MSRQKKPRILIGSLTRAGTGSIPTVTRAFMEGLSDRYEFIPHYAERQWGTTRTARLNVTNLLYFIRHFVSWIMAIVRYRPQLVHYPVTSGWNIEKSMIFLRVPRLFGCKTIGHLHGGAFDVIWARMPAWRQRLARRWIGRLDAFVVTSPYWASWTGEHLSVEPLRRGVVMNPIDRAFEDVALAFPPATSDDLFFIGAIGKRKGVYDLLRVAEELRAHGYEGSVHLAGPEDRPGDLQKVRDLIGAGRSGPSVFHPPLYGEEKSAYFRDHGIFVFPSYNENFPLVIIEAAAAGRPIITTKVGALPEYFEHEKTVLFVPPGDIGAIVDAVERLLRDAGLRQCLALNARELFVQRLSRRVSMANLDGVYRRVLGHAIEGPTGGK